ncbi:MAG: hypothetical protein PUF56_02835, partial [Lachnospiraceae bacterium]|nr:hypothetical protein [Lachnospiraceae bacterium]
YGMMVVFSCYDDKTINVFQQYMTYLKQKADQMKEDYGSLENAISHMDENGNLPEDVTVDKDGNRLEKDPTQVYSKEEIENAAARTARELQEQYKKENGAS